MRAIARALQGHAQPLLSLVLLAALVGTVTSPAAGAPAGISSSWRIVSTAPSLTETLFALGLGDRVVGVTTFCRYPEEARRLPKIGGYTNPSLEAILALKPDLVVVEHAETIERRLAELGIPTLSVRPEDFRSIDDSIRALALRAGVPERGEKLVAEIAAQRAAVARASAGRSRPRTLLLLGHSPDSSASFFAAGPRSFLGEMLAAAGGENILAGVETPYPRVSVEEVVGRDPDVILVVLSPPVEGASAAARARQLWSAYPSMKAVRTGAIRVIVDDTMLQPGPRVGDKTAALARALRGDEP